MAANATDIRLDDNNLVGESQKGLLNNGSGRDGTVDKKENTYQFDPNGNTLNENGKTERISNRLDASEQALSDKDIKRAKFSITKSQWAVNIAFFLAWTSIAGLTIIQSSVIGLVGTIGLSLNFAFSILGATVVAPLSIRFLGCKRSMILGLASIVVCLYFFLRPVVILRNFAHIL